MYRRRRIAATTGSAVAVIVMIWAAGALLSSSGGDSVTNAASRQTVTLTSGPQSNPPATGRLVPAWASSSSSSSAPTMTTSLPASTTTSPTGPATTGPATTPPPPAPPQGCPDNVVRLTITTGQPGYRVGQHPEFTLHIANTGPVPCFRDVSRPLRTIVLTPAGSAAPLWSSVDCYATPSHEIPLLAPGQEVRYSVVWAGRTSAPGCPLSRKTVPAGNYALSGHLGPLSGPPTPFTLQPSG